MQNLTDENIKNYLTLLEIIFMQNNTKDVLES